MIDKIGYTRPTTAAQRASAAKRTEGTSGTQFAEALSRAEGVGETAGVEATTSVNSVGSLGGLLGIQEVGEKETNRRKAVRRGRLTLDVLAQLRDALLIGTLPLSTLDQLEKMVAEERGSTTDPLLNGILDEIELRAAVEIAKLEMAGIHRERE